MARQPKPDKYGLLPAEREAMEIVRGNRCDICGRPPAGRRLHVDHHHACAKWDKRGSVRGLLCMRCNRGFFNENPELMRLAAAYLERHKCSAKPPSKRKSRLTS